MNAEAWGIALTTVGVLVAVFGVVSRSLAKEQMRQEKLVDDVVRRYDKLFEDMRRDMREELRRLEELCKQLLLGLDTRLQNEIKMLIEASHLRVAALEARWVEMDRELRVAVRPREP